MIRFAVKVEACGERFVAAVPALPGCVTGGKTREEALANASGAIRAALAHLARLGVPVQGSAPVTGEVEYVEVPTAPLAAC